MSKKWPIVIGVIWLLAATALYGCYVWNHRPDGIYTYNNDGCSVEQDVYVSDNDEDTGYIYKMDLYGQIKDFVSTRELKLVIISVVITRSCCLILLNLNLKDWIISSSRLVEYFNSIL